MENETSKPVTAKDKMKNVDELLDEYESRVGLPTYNETAISNQINKILQLQSEDLEKLSPEQCAEIAVHCEQASFSLQRASNREVGHVTWATDALKLALAGKTQNYRGSFQQQEMQAVAEDGYARDLFRIKGYAQQRVDRLQFLSASLHRFAERMYGLQMAKSRKE